MAIVSLLVMLPISAMAEWQGDAQVTSSRLGTPGEKLSFKMDLNSIVLRVDAWNPGEPNARLAREVNLHKFGYEEFQDGDYFTCVPNGDGTFEVHNWIVYEAGELVFMNYRYDAARSICLPGPADLKAFWLEDKR